MGYAGNNYDEALKICMTSYKTIAWNYGEPKLNLERSMKVRNALQAKMAEMQENKMNKYMGELSRKLPDKHRLKNKPSYEKWEDYAIEECLKVFRTGNQTKNDKKLPMISEAGVIKFTSSARGLDRQIEKFRWFHKFQQTFKLAAECYGRAIVRCNDTTKKFDFSKKGNKLKTLAEEYLRMAQAIDRELFPKVPLPTEQKMPTVDKVPAQPVGGQYTRPVHHPQPRRDDPPHTYRNAA